ncbi:MAG: rhomboid family intramembrane serine protease [Muribaculaceae bacterium]|nr:rhomboid family intramembrane serine protease [Muribaculaceae bacterium]
MPPVTKNLLIINCLFWLATMVFDHVNFLDLTQYLGLHFWRAADFNAAQLVSYMFMHDQSNFMHLFFNMFSLWMFGMTLERVLGPKRFLFYYLTCGLGAAFIQQLVWEFTWEQEFVRSFAALNSLSFGEVRSMLASGQIAEYVGQYWGLHVTVGASGAVFGILLAFGMLFPNLPMYIIPFPFPIKAKWMVIGYGAIELFCGVTGQISGVAHYAHLGGMLFGFLLIIYWRKKGVLGGPGNGFY